MIRNQNEKIKNESNNSRLLILSITIWVFEFEIKYWSSSHDQITIRFELRSYVTDLKRKKDLKNFPLDNDDDFEIDNIYELL